MTPLFRIQIRTALSGRQTSSARYERAHHCPRLGGGPAYHGVRPRRPIALLVRGRLSQLDEIACANADAVAEKHALRIMALNTSLKSMRSLSELGNLLLKTPTQLRVGDLGEQVFDSCRGQKSFESRRRSPLPTASHVRSSRGDAKPLRPLEVRTLPE